MKTARVLIALVMLAATSVAYGQYPDRPVKIVFPFVPGGSGDALARIVASRLTELSGKSFIVENKPGAGGRIGYEAAAKSAPDGYTLAATDSSYTVLPAMYPELKWGPTNHLVPVAAYVDAPFVIAVNSASRFKTMQQLLDFARANPNKVTFGSAGIGSINHVVTELLERDAKVDFLHVPFKGMGDVVTGVLSGSVDLMITASPTAIPYVQGGKMIALAVTSEKRSSVLPNVPTVAELGVPGFKASVWFGLTAPKDTPKEVISYLNKQMSQVLATSSVKERIAQLGAEPWDTTPEEFGKVMQDNARQWVEIVKSARIKPE